jgi:hypothetical protein
MSGTCTRTGPARPDSMGKRQGELCPALNVTQRVGHAGMLLKKSQYESPAKAAVPVAAAVSARAQSRPAPPPKSTFCGDFQYLLIT